MSIRPDNIERNKKVFTGKPSWNKGLHGVQPPHSKEWRENHSKKLKGKKPKNLGVSFGLSREKNVRWSGGDNNLFRAKTAPRPKPIQCEVCGAFGKDFKNGLHLDHDHTTKKFRGWLCCRCNVALGMVKDNTETLIALAEYIKKSREI
jgi:hypothetical protein